MARSTITNQTDQENQANEGTIRSQDQMDRIANELFPQETMKPADRILMNIIEKQESIRVNLQELKAAEHVLKRKKYTGPDGI